MAPDQLSKAVKWIKKVGRWLRWMTDRAAAIILIHRPKTLNKTIVFTTWYFVVGLLIFHMVADFKNPQWWGVYYLWDKSLDLLFFLILYAIVPKAKSVFVPVIYYTILRLCFQVLTITVGTDTNDKRIVNTLYLTLLVVFICQSIKELKNEWNQRH